jgi:hypothetical protein
MFDQLSQLGVDALWTHLTLIDLDKNTFVYRMTSKDGKPVHAEQVVQLDAMDSWSHTVETFKSQNPETVTQIHFAPEVLPRVWELFDEIFSSLPKESKMSPEDFPNGIHTTEANCKFGYLGINQSREATPEEKKILGRFGSEFGRLYQRYLDIEKAQLQAREAQIEASLERVRARAMAMHQTDELTDVLCVLFEQFYLLGINPVLTHLSLFDEENETFSIRLTTTADNGMVAEQLIDIHAIEAWKKAFEQWKNCEPNSVNTIDYAPEDLPYLWDLLSEVMAALPEGHKINPTDFPDGLFTAQGHFQFGYLGFNHSRKATEEEKSIVSRFAREFGRTYQRFLDLEKAEAQVKEAQIEAALEKVRSRSLGMQNTKEMQLVANEIREQLLSLGVSLDAMAMSGVIDNEADYDVWVGGAISEKPLRIPYNNDTQVQRDYNKVIKERPELFMKTYSGKIMKEYFKQLMDTNSFNPEIEKFMKECSAFTTTLTFMKNSGIQIIRYTPEPFSNSDNQIVIRFGKVFEQAYIRFLDLQKAETQAREARIEAALEKIRSRTMGMQSSSELPGVANLLFLEVQALGIPAWSCGYCILLEDGKSSTCIMSSEGTLQKPFLLPHYGEVSFEEWDEFVHGEETFFTQELGGKAIESHYDFMKSLPQLAPIFKEIEEAGLSLPTYQINHLCKFAHGFLLFITYESVPDAYDIFKRFTKVFDQTYKRFLDLKKAKAQAREAQIEAALERVRSKTMGMHKSEDLLDVIQTVYDQLVHLNLKIDNIGFITDPYQSDDYNIWSADPNGVLPNKLHIRYFEHPVNRDYTEHRNSGQELSSKLYSFDEKNTYWKGVFKNMSGVPEEIKEILLDGRLASPGLTVSRVLTKNIILYLFKFDGTIYSDEENAIFIRFSRVFEQTYTRFLDLQKAEAQAREAQIEAALEKVRSRSLAMHKSVELTEVVAVLFEKLKDLQIPFTAVGIATGIEGSKDLNAFVCGQNDAGLVITNYRLPYFNNPIPKDLYKALEKQSDFFVGNYSKDEKDTFYKYVIEHTAEFRHLPEDIKRMIFDSPTYAISMVAVKNAVFNINDFEGKVLTESEIDIIKRFARVFDQAYTRFLDLQKAEAQAREAKIEAALEKIRSRTMGMQSSEEL